MNKWVKRKWVKALRSGEYKQVQGALFDVDDNWKEVISYCCLGVAIAEMYPEAFQVREIYPGTYQVKVGDAGSNGQVADDLATLWELDKDSQEVLANMNDDGTEFPAIADWIDENL